jgi:gluconolactonase
LPDGSLLVVELARGTLTHVNTADGSLDVVASLGGNPSGVALGPDGAAYICNGGGYVYQQVGRDIHPVGPSPSYRGGYVQRVDLQTGDSEVIYEACNGHRLVGPNDIVFDSVGGFYFTDKGKARERDRDWGGIYYASPDGSKIVPAKVPVDDPNGIGISPDGGSLYVADTSSARVWKWTISSPGVLENPTVDRVLSRISRGAEFVFGSAGFQLFDSLAIENSGRIIVGTIGQPGGLTVIDPDIGSGAFIGFPEPYVTNICFGGSDLRKAYVTLGSTGELVSAEWPNEGLALAW